MCLKWNSTCIIRSSSSPHQFYPPGTKTVAPHMSLQPATNSLILHLPLNFQLRILEGQCGYWVQKSMRKPTKLWEVLFKPSTVWVSERRIQWSFLSIVCMPWSSKFAIKVSQAAFKHLTNHGSAAPAEKWGNGRRRRTLWWKDPVIRQSHHQNIFQSYRIQIQLYRTIPWKNQAAILSFSNFSWEKVLA